MSDEPSCCNQDQKPRKRRYKAWLRDSTTNIPKSTLEYRSMIEIAEKDCLKNNDNEIDHQGLVKMESNEFTIQESSFRSHASVLSDVDGDNDRVNDDIVTPMMVATQDDNVNDSYTDDSENDNVDDSYADDLENKEVTEEYDRRNIRNNTLNPVESDGDDDSINESDDESLYNQHLQDYDETHEYSTSASNSVNDGESEMGQYNELLQNSQITKEESEILIMAYLLRHSIPDVGLDTLVKLIDCHLSCSVYQSKYRFLKSFPSYKEVKYYFCPDCEIIIYFDVKSESTCEKCGKIYKKKSHERGDYFFIHIPLKEQIQEIIESHLYEYFRKDCLVSDIVNSKVYKDLRENVIGDNDLTIQINVDGANFFKSSKKSIWPIQVIINELPYRIRKNNVLLCGLWYSSKKPLMNLYLKPFVDELIMLSENGFECENINREKIQVKIHPILCSVDSIARPMMQNMKQFNGKFGCSYCLHEGQQVHVGRGSTRVYPYKKVSLRTRTNYQNHLRFNIATEKPVKGVKGPSIMSRLPTIHMIHSFVPDYMHALLLGVIKLFATSWFDSKHNSRPFYIGLRVAEFNEKLSRVKPPCEITRILTSIGDLSKATEWKNFALYYSLPCLENILPKKYLVHWNYFVLALHLLSKDIVCEEDLGVARNALDKFLRSIESLYGIEFMKFNVHLMTHIPSYVEYYGALWAWSAFPFESFNRVIKNLQHGTQYIPEQINKSYCRLRFIKNRAHVFSREHVNPKARNLFLTMMNECKVNNCIIYENLRVFGQPKLKILRALEKFVIEQNTNAEIEENCKSFSRFIERNILYHATHNRLRKRKNSTVILEDGSIMDILELVAVTCTRTLETKYLVLGTKMRILDEYICKGTPLTSGIYSYVTRKSPCLVAYETSFIRNKAIQISMTNKRVCVISLVNKMETD